MIKVVNATAGFLKAALRKTADFIIKIRNSEESTRMRWLYVFTGGAMTIVIFLWLVYLNSIVKPLNENVQVTAKKPQGPGLTQIFGAGFKVVLGGTNEVLSEAGALLKRKLSKSKLITVEASDKNFIMEDLEEIPKTPLP